VRPENVSSLNPHGAEPGVKRTEETEKGSLVQLEFSYDLPVVGAIGLEGRTSCYTEASTRTHLNAVPSVSDFEQTRNAGINRSV